MISKFDEKINQSNFKILPHIAFRCHQMDSLITTSLVGTKLQMNGGNGRNKKYYCQQWV